MFYHINCYSLYTCIIYMYMHILRLIRAFESFFHDHRGSNSWALEAGGLTTSDSAVPSRLETVWQGCWEGLTRKPCGFVGKMMIWWLWEKYGKIMKNIGQWWKTYGKFTNHHWMIGKIIYFLLDYPTMICNFNSSLLNMLHRNSLFTELKDCDFHC